MKPKELALTIVGNLLEQVEREFESKNNIKASFEKTLPHGFPPKLITAMRKWPVISKSPFSHSYYDITNKGWDDDGHDKFHRISDHWNFKTRFDDRVHCKTSETVNAGWWTLAVYDLKTKSYKIIESIPPLTAAEIFEPGKLPDKELWRGVKVATTNQLGKILGGGDQRGSISRLIADGYFAAAKSSDIAKGFKVPAFVKSAATGDSVLIYRVKE